MPPCQPPWWSSFLLGEWTKVWCPAMKKWKGTTFLAKVPSCEGAPIKTVFFQDMLPSGPFSQRRFGTSPIKIVSHLTLCSSAVHVWLTFFPKASLGVPFFQRSLVEHFFPNFLFLQQPFFQRFTFWTWHWLPWKQCCQPCWPIASTLSLCPLPPWLCWQFLEA